MIKAYPLRAQYSLNSFKVLLFFLWLHFKQQTIKFFIVCFPFLEIGIKWSNPRYLHFPPQYWHLPLAAINLFSSKETFIFSKAPRLLALLFVTMQRIFIGFFKRQSFCFLFIVILFFAYHLRTMARRFSGFFFAQILASFILFSLCLRYVSFELIGISKWI